MNQASLVVESFDSTVLPSIQDIFGVDTLNRKRVYEEFYKKYNQFVVHELSKRNTFKLNFEDLTARVWVDFSGSSSGIGLIEKFFTQVANTVTPELPETVDSAGLLELLNITWEDWVQTWSDRNKKNARAYRKLPRLPEPIEGSFDEETAVYNSMDIFEWYLEFECVRHLFVPASSNAWVLQLPTPKATKRYFINYLKTSIQNRWANFCRYESRRHQERVWDTFPDQRSALEDPAPWEDRQETPSNQEEDAELALLVQRLQKSVAAPQIKPILLSMFDEGLSVQAAIEKSELSVEQKRRAIRDVCSSPTRSIAA